MCRCAFCRGAAIEDSTRAEILRNYETSLPGPPPVTLFQRAAEEVKTLMNQEIYPAFVQSREFSELLESGLL